MVFDCYYHWLGIPPHEQPPNHYRLLGLSQFEANPSVIATMSDQRMALVKSYEQADPQTVQQLLYEMALARLCLLNDRTRHDYDQQLRAVLSAKLPHAVAAPARVPTAPPQQQAAPARPRATCVAM